MSQQAPDAITPIVGWRAWYIDQTSVLDGPRLFSLHDRTEWEPGEWTRAECSRYRGDDVEEHGIPSELCSCGMYAANTRPHLAMLGYGGYAHAAYWRVIGQVELAGKVIVGTQGWRAEMARPRRLFVPYSEWRIVKPLRATYGVPVEITNTLKGK